MNKVKENQSSFIHSISFIVFAGLEERLRAQNNSNTNKPLTARNTTSTTKSTRHTFKDEKIESHTDKNGVCYKIGGTNINQSND